LSGYIYDRAQVEGVSSELDNQWFTMNLLNGCRSFFGVELDEQCTPLRDSQEPEPGYFKRAYREWRRDNGGMVMN
jgi:hypothetical protein